MYSSSQMFKISLNLRNTNDHAKIKSRDKWCLTYYWCLPYKKVCIIFNKKFVTVMFFVECEVSKFKPEALSVIE